jgi:hypothetical protein
MDLLSNFGLLQKEISRGSHARPRALGNLREVFGELVFFDDAKAIFVVSISPRL